MTCSSTTTRSATRRSRFALTAHRDSGCAGTRKWILADNFHVALILPELAAGAMITSHKTYQMGSAPLEWLPNGQLFRPGQRYLLTYMIFFANVNATGKHSSLPNVTSVRAPGTFTQIVRLLMAIGMICQAGVLMKLSGAFSISFQTPGAGGHWVEIWLCALGSSAAFASSASLQKGSLIGNAAAGIGCALAWSYYAYSRLTAICSGAPKLKLVGPEYVRRMFCSALSRSCADEQHCPK